MGTILLVIQVIIALALIFFVLIQRSDGDGMSGLGGGASGGSGIISARGKANFMTRSTAILAAAFMLNSLLMAIVTSQNSSRSLVDKIESQSNGEMVAKTNKDAELNAPLGDELSNGNTAKKENKKIEKEINKKTETKSPKVDEKIKEVAPSKETNKETKKTTGEDK